MFTMVRRVRRMHRTFVLHADIYEGNGGSCKL